MGSYLACLESRVSCRLPPSLLIGTAQQIFHHENSIVGWKKRSWRETIDKENWIESKVEMIGESIYIDDIPFSSNFTTPAISF